MKLEEYLRNLEGIIQRIEDEKVRSYTIAGMDAADAIVQRLQEKGLDDEGQSFDDYTPRYKYYKKENYRYRGFRDHTLTGAMLRSVRARLEKTTNGYVIVVGVSEAEKEKLSENQIITGKKLISLTKEEKEIIMEDIRARWVEFFKQLGL